MTKPDETGLVNNLKKYLMRQGYEGASTDSADEAWRPLETKPTAYFLILINMNMTAEEQRPQILRPSLVIAVVALVDIWIELTTLI